MRGGGHAYGRGVENQNLCIDMGWKVRFESSRFVEVYAMCCILRFPTGVTMSPFLFRSNQPHIVPGLWRCVGFHCRMIIHLYVDYVAGQ